MAHSDTLIFLTNVTWTFFLFMLIYLVFVLFFIPSFFKKIRFFGASRMGWALDGLYALINVPATLSSIFYFFSESVLFFKRLSLLLSALLMTYSFAVCVKRLLSNLSVVFFNSGLSYELTAAVSSWRVVKFLGFAVDGDLVGLTGEVYFVKF